MEKIIFSPLSLPQIAGSENKHAKTHKAAKIFAKLDQAFDCH